MANFVLGRTARHVAVIFLGCAWAAVAFGVVPATRPAPAAAPASQPACKPTGAPLGDVTFSGMAKVAEGRFVVVLDTKADVPGDHVGLIEFAERTAGARPLYRPLTLVGLPFRPNDLEAACQMPGAANEVLAVEGRTRGDGKRFLWRLAIRADAGDARVVGAPIELPAELADEPEGLAALPPAADGGPNTLLFGLRGGEQWTKPGDPPKPPLPGLIVTAAYDPAAGRVRLSAGPPLRLDPPAGGWRPGSAVRGCGDLLLVRRTPGGPADEVLSVATDDPGDAGPFRSVVYRAAWVQDGRVVAAPADDCTVAVLEGVKVEALAAGVVTTGNDGAAVECPLTFATDDEAFGGVWRPLLPASPRAAAAAP